MYNAPTLVVVLRTHPVESSIRVYALRNGFVGAGRRSCISPQRLTYGGEDQNNVSVTILKKNGGSLDIQKWKIPSKRW